MRRLGWILGLLTLGMPATSRAQHYSVGGEVCQAFMEMDQAIPPCDPNLYLCPGTGGDVVFALDQNDLLSFWSIPGDNLGFGPWIEKFEVRVLSGQNADLLVFEVPYASSDPLVRTYAGMDATKKADLLAGNWYIQAVGSSGEIFSRGTILPDLDCTNFTISQVQCTVYGTPPMLIWPGAAPTRLSNAVPDFPTAGSSYIEVLVTGSTMGGPDGPIRNLARDAIRAFPWNGDPNITLCGSYGYTCEFPTDKNGRTIITTMPALGCTEQLGVEVCGVVYGPVTISVRSADVLPASPGVVAFNDLLVLAWYASTSATNAPCADYNDSGTIDTSDTAAWQSIPKASCFLNPE